MLAGVIGLPVGHVVNDQQGLGHGYSVDEGGKNRRELCACYPASAIGLARRGQKNSIPPGGQARYDFEVVSSRSEEHTSELQSRENLVCRLLLEKKKKKHK